MSIMDVYLKMLTEAASKDKTKMDPVDKNALKGDHEDRKDKDIDNDGDSDDSDEYLHNRRKAISKKTEAIEIDPDDGEVTQVSKKKKDKESAKSGSTSDTVSEDTTQYMWADINKALITAGVNGDTVLEVVSALKNKAISEVSSPEAKGEKSFKDAHGQTVIDRTPKDDQGVTAKVKVAPKRIGDNPQGDKIKKLKDLRK
jgi:hypothetical protein|tara:strand:+ start:9172 stop:9771 length:600 start_codon:yes stop_codon:yes gene_type:complete